MLFLLPHLQTEIPLRHICSYCEHTRCDGAAGMHTMQTCVSSVSLHVLAAHLEYGLMTRAPSVSAPQSHPGCPLPPHHPPARHGLACDPGGRWLAVPNAWQGSFDPGQRLCQSLLSGDDLLASAVLACHAVCTHSLIHHTLFAIDGCKLY